MSEKLKKAETKPVSVEEHLRIGVNFRKELRKVLGKIPPEHFIRMALTAMQKQPKLAQCTQESVFQCLLDCASLDLEPDGRRAHLIPYGNVCTLIIDYKGYVDLMTRPGKGNEVAFVDAAIVYDTDDFEWNMNSVIRHRYDLKSDKHGKKEEAIAAYVAIHFKNGMVKYELMTKAEILSVKTRSKAKDSGPWVTDELEMWKKCPLRRAAKWVPINDQTAHAMEVDYDRFEELEPGLKSDAPVVPLLAENQESEKSEKKTESKSEEKADNPATSKEPPPDLKLTSEGKKKLDVFDTLEKELAEFCDGDGEMMQERLMALTSFPEMKKDKNGKYTKEPTGKMVTGVKFVSELRMKNSTVRAEIALQKLRDEVNGER